MRGIRSDGLRPGDPLVVVVCLDDAGHVASHPDPVAAHDDRAALAVLAKVGRPHGYREVGSQLEDVSHLNAVLERHRVAAYRARITLAGVDDVDHDVGREVAPNVDVA